MSTATSPSSLLTNLFYLGGARLTVVCMNLVTTSFMARALGVESYGILNFSLSYVAYFIIVVGLGYDTLVTRDVAHDPSRTQRIVEGVLAVRTVLAALCIVAMALGLIVLDRPALTNAAIMVHAITLVSVSIGLSSVFQGLQDMRTIALREFGTSLINLVATLTLIRASGDVVLAVAIGSLTQLSMNLLIMRKYRHHFGTPTLRLPRAEDLHFARQSLPFFWLGLLIAVTYNLHFVLLGLMRSEAEVGYFAAGWKLFNFAIILPNLLSALFLPRIAQLRDKPEQRATTTLAAMQAILITILPITLLGQGVVTPILLVLFGPGYLPAASVLDMLFLSALAVGINVGLGMPLIALGRQGILLRAVAIGAGIGIVANAILVPEYGIEGAAVATLLTEAVTLVVLLLNRPDMPLRAVAGFGLRCLVAVLPAAWLTHWLSAGPLQGQPALPALALAGAAGGVAYLLLLPVAGIRPLRVLADLRSLR